MTATESMQEYLAEAYRIACYQPETLLYLPLR